MGYVPGQVAPMDMSRQADDLRKAMKGFGTDEKALIGILAPMDPLQAAGVRQAFTQRHRRDLLKDIESETSGYFRDGLMAMARGPLEQDVLNANKAIKGFGTKEAILNDVLLGRSNADINAIKAHYHHVYKKSLESDVKGDLSLKTERLFDMVLAARRNEESSPVIPQQIEADVSELYRATEGSKIGCDQVAVCAVLTQRSDGQLRAISKAYRQKYHRELAEVLKSNFSGHMEDALLYILLNAEDRAKHDAQLLEAAMSGMGTKDDLLVNRIVRIHWDKHRMSQARGAYRHFFQRELADRIRGETRGDYEKLMVATVQSA
jgi:annexin A7/11